MFSLFLLQCVIVTFFIFVHFFVGIFEQGFKRNLVVLGKFDTKRKADGTGSGRVTKLVTAMLEAAFGNPCQNDSEFIATDAVDIFTAKAVAEDFCGITDVLVAGKMAFGIIHPLQTVEVAHNDSNRLGNIEIFPFERKVPEEFIRQLDEYFG